MKAFILPLSVSTRLLLARVGAVFLLLCGIAVSSVGIWGLVEAWNVYGASEPDILVCDSSSDEDLSREVASITVAVSGAVAKPGMYTLSAGSRVGELLSEAGGFSSEVDSVFSQTGLNLAQPLSDGEGIYIPLQADSEVVSQCASLVAMLSQNQQKIEVETDSSESGGVVSITTATFDQLDALPGIGEKRAQAIIDGRPYTTIDELLERQIVTESVFEDIQDLIQL